MKKGMKVRCVKPKVNDRFTEGKVYEVINAGVGENCMFYKRPFTDKMQFNAVNDAGTVSHLHFTSCAFAWWELVEDE